MIYSSILQEAIQQIRPTGLPSEEEMLLLDNEAKEKLLEEQNAILKIIRKRYAEEIEARQAEIRFYRNKQLKQPVKIVEPKPIEPSIRTDYPFNVKSPRNKVQGTISRKPPLKFSIASKTTPTFYLSCETKKKPPKDLPSKFKRPRFIP